MNKLIASDVSLKYQRENLLEDQIFGIEGAIEDWTQYAKGEFRIGNCKLCAINYLIDEEKQEVREETCMVCPVHLTVGYCGEHSAYIAYHSATSSAERCVAAKEAVLVLMDILVLYQELQKEEEASGTNT